MSSPASRRYAKALFMIGVEENRLDALTREVRAVADTVKSSPEHRDAERAQHPDDAR